MIRLRIPPGYVAAATERALTLPMLPNSIVEDTKAKVAGFLGEALVTAVYGGTPDSTSSHDLLIRRHTAEVKTQRCKYEPKFDWNAIVAATSNHQHPDFYYFVCVLEDFSLGWIIGYISRELFYKHAAFKRKGEGDVHRRDWYFRADCYALSYADVQKLGGMYPV